MNSHFIEHEAQPAQGESHNVKKVTVNAADKQRAQPLRPICSGFVHGLAGGYIKIDFPVGNIPEADFVSS